MKSSSCSRSANQCIGRSLALLLLMGLCACQSGAQQSAAEPQVFTDVPYAGRSAAQKMDLYLPAGPGPFPAVVLIHGGAFKMGDKRMEERQAKALVAAGYAAVAINYRLSGEAIFPAAVHDAKAAVRFLRGQAAAYHIDTSRIASWGASAGGYLSAMLGTSGGDAFLEGSEGDFTRHSSRVQAFIDWFGPIDFASMTAEARSLGFPANYSVDNESKFMGLDVTSPANLEQVRRASPAAYIDAGDPPSWIQVGSADPLIPFTQSLHFYEALKAAVGEGHTAFERLEGAGHGGPAFGAPDNLKKAIDFLDARLKPKNPVP